ncbi:peroxiredoxin [Castellaniella sp. GW247-6E4]|uniref:peroxiredoxin n=1 Tax=Castellaniella sp. GW247-6E4 TaxID=3140380 RepID=UPI0033152CCA
MTQIATGRPLPAFTASSTAGDIDSRTLHGRPFVLYFYPKDNTPGCTTESQDFRDLYAQFQAAGCAVLGVSRDSLKSHEGFIEKQSLPFPLISDPDEALCTLFDVMKLKNMYGKQVRGIDRSTFLIDKDGVLVREWRGVRVPDHALEVLQTVQTLAA